MPLDAYSVCPCGTGKRIKFCCPDLLGELQKIDRMIEGEQHLGCLQHIEQLLEQHPDRACLMAIKGMLLRATSQIEVADANADAFIQKHPDNPIALAESAITTAMVKRDPHAALAMLQGALAASADGMQSRVYAAINIVAAALFHEGEWLAGRSLLQLQMAIAPDDKRPMEMLVQINRSPDVPLLMKDDQPLAPCPDNPPWKARFEEALASADRAGWPAAAEQFSALADELPEVPEVWRNLAILRSWLADTPGSIEALRKYASLDVPWEDAVEASALAMFLSDSPLGDPLDVLHLEWELSEFDQVQAALALEKRAVQLPVDPASLPEDGSPPPKGVYLLLDQPIGETADNLTLENVPRFLGQVMLYGRQTDREARLEVVGVTAGALEPVKALIGELAGDALKSEVKQEVEATISASQDLLQSKMRPPADTSMDRFESLSAEYRRDALLHRWPEMKLGIFAGRSPREVAADDSRHVDLLAAVMVLEFWCDRMPGKFDFNELRRDLGLPPLEPIDPDQTPVDEVPLVRLPRVMVEKLSDDALVSCYRRAAMFAATAALRTFARAVVERPGLAGRDEQLWAYRHLAQTESDPQQALQYLHQGRAATEALGRSPADWLLTELSLRFALGEVEEVNRLIREIQTRYIEEPGVAERLTQFLVGIGALRPDMTPTGPSPEPATAADTEPERLWTPGGEQSGGGGGKLWTPD